MTDALVRAKRGGGKSGGVQLGAPGAVDKMVMAGVERILSMQTPAGGFGYWPGDDQPTPVSISGWMRSA